MKELTLENGARVRVRPVPPHVEALFDAGVRAKIPQEPRPPMRRVKMADGHFEEDIVTEGPEMDAYQVEIAEWIEARGDIVMDAYVSKDFLKLDYAVVAWTPSGEEWIVDDIMDTIEGRVQEWQTDTPVDWQFPDALDRAGVKSCGNRRIDFIGIELLTTEADAAAVEAIANGQTSAITDEEAARVRASFRAGRGQKRDGATARGGFFRRLARALSRRDGGGEGVGLDA